jgi:hypothetical protein
MGLYTASAKNHKNENKFQPFETKLLNCFTVFSYQQYLIAPMYAGAKSHH